VIGFGVTGGLVAAYVLWLAVRGTPPPRSGWINGWAEDAFLSGGRRRLRDRRGVPVVSEALTNSAKHANATAVHVDVDATHSAVRLAVRDDGVGGADPACGSGLLGLYDRVEAAGGTITIHSPIGEGTELLVELPLRPVPAPD